MALDFLREPSLECGEPSEFVVVLVAADLLAVGHVGTDDANVVDRGGDQAFLDIVEVRVATDNVAGDLAREQGDAVVGLLSAEGNRVTGGFDLMLGERAVFELRFLQTDDVRLAQGQPFEQLRQAHLERIDVPAGDSHLAKAPDGLAP